MYDVCSFGELLIDFTAVKLPGAANLMFERNPGGAPANVAAAVARLGHKSAFLGKVGDDLFGRFLKETMEENGVDVSGLRLSKEYNTMLAFVQLSDAGDRSFSFYRNPSADMTYDDGDIAGDVIKNSKIFHFGSLMMTNEPVRSATLTMVKMAKEAGRLVSFDPNLRELLWDDLARAKKEIITGLPYSDLLKVSFEEMEFVTGETDLEAGSKKLAEYGPGIVLVTMGPGGCFYRSGDMTGRLYTYDTKVVDTTGSGDAFYSAFLCKVLQSGKAPEELSRQELEAIIDFANGAGSLTATKRGAIPALPTEEEILACMKNTPKLVVS